MAASAQGSSSAAAAEPAAAQPLAAAGAPTESAVETPPDAFPFPRNKDSAQFAAAKSPRSARRRRGALALLAVQLAALAAVALVLACASRLRSSSQRLPGGPRRLSESSEDEGGPEGGPPCEPGPSHFGVSRLLGTSSVSVASEESSGDADYVRPVGSAYGPVTSLYHIVELHSESEEEPLDLSMAHQQEQQQRQQQQLLLLQALTQGPEDAGSRPLWLPEGFPFVEGPWGPMGQLRGPSSSSSSSRGAPPASRRGPSW
ncbi:hypothetical protein, conserved [Eimeria tenella]|uniref:Uncharacterized protein n=1 Tax=Eimeria tenella TaxID=5802 RepID=U6L940_EIMTE|nr:hypothetical protein, conserved [Eimeria tenella]CDJ45069.1 hypothetical protein, conserved [Eimeria tenella]|eukprot:XP_013235816.1 hypothetical protein, conserved [Eimeria tenella]